MYSTISQAFAFAQMMGSADTEKGTPTTLAQQLASKVDGFLADATLVDLMGTWTRVFGPVVWQAPQSETIDNAMMVVHCANTRTYMVAIAGTNPLSAYDLAVEDLTVSPLVPWAWGAGTGASIATGTSAGVNNLLGCTDPGTASSLSTFLAGVADAKTSTLVFCGHSLGGALAPVLALALFNPQGSLASVGWSSVAVSATAGPTPGDQGFVDLFAATFPPRDGLNTLIWNSLDVVPHAWAPSTFTASILENLYRPKISASSCVGCLVAAALTRTPTPNPYVQLPNDGPFTGTFQDHPADLDPTKAFVAELLYQHIMGYYDQLTPALVDVLHPFDPYSFDGGRLVVDKLTDQVLAYCKGQSGCS